MLGIGVCGLAPLFVFPKLESQQVHFTLKKLEFSRRVGLVTESSETLFTNGERKNMGTLQIFLFGGVRIVHTPEAADTRLTRSLQALLGYLLLQCDRSHARDVLAGTFWGNQSQLQARKCLSTALWRLRSVLEPEGIPNGTYLVATSNGEIGFNPQSDYWLDVNIFEKQVNQVIRVPLVELQASHIEQLEKGLQLYRGDFMEGFYQDWALLERERLRHLYLRGLECLMLYYAQQGAYQQSLDYGRMILQYDSLREEIHRAVMRFHLALGQRALAARQYETCRDILATELGISPLAETQSLYHSIVLDTAERQPPTLAKAEQAQARGQMLQCLRLTVEGLDKMREQLLTATRLIEEITDS